MDFFYYLRREFLWITNKLIDLAIDCYNSSILPDFLGDAFGYFSDKTADIATWLYDASDWWETVEDAISDILSWTEIRSLIRGWLTDIETIVSWFPTKFEYILDTIDLWWPTVESTIKGWISTAIAGLEEAWEDWQNFWSNLWPSFVDNFNNLKSAWDNFWTTTLPNLLSFDTLTVWWDSRIAEVQALIESIILTWFPFYNSLTSLWDSIAEFITDPLQWLYNKMDEWFERFW